MLADLEEGRVLGGLDEIAFGIDLEQARGFAMNLPAQNERGGKGTIGGFKRGAVDLADVTHGIADDAGGLIHGFHGQQRRTAMLFLGIHLLVENGNHRLCHSQITGGQDHQNAVAFAFPDMHFAENGNIIKARIGARIGCKDKAAIKAQANTIGHHTPRLFVTPAKSGGAKPAVFHAYCCVCVTTTSTERFSTPCPLRIPRNGAA